MKTMIRLATLSAVLVVLLGCKALNQGNGTTPAESEGIRHAVVAWLELEEPMPEDLAKVTSLGQRAVPTLSATLLRGLSAAKREQVRQHLSATYSQLRDYEITHPEAQVSMTREEYLATYEANYTNLWRGRAATALGAIGGRNAKQALQTALAQRLPEDVSQVVKEALAKIQ